MIDIEYANAYSEVLEILKYIPIEDYDKIPKNRINLFKAYANNDHAFCYDTTKTLEEQNVSKTAKAIIAILFRDYWATELQKEKIIAKQNYDRIQLEEKKKERYNSDNIFKNNKKKIILDGTKQEQKLALIEINNIKWYKKVWKFITRFFSK